jgi:hypothetical protein
MDEMPDVKPLSPQERLAASRNALLRHMTRHDHDLKSRAEDPLAISGETQDVEERPRNSFKAMAHAARTWWEHQPAHVAVDIARPVIGRFAERTPLKLLGISAGIGAAVVLLRPWRLVSVGGLLLAAVKSAAVPSVLLSMLSSGPQDPTRVSETS